MAMLKTDAEPPCSADDAICDAWRHARVPPPPAASCLGADEPSAFVLSELRAAAGRGEHTHLPVLQALAQRGSPIPWEGPNGGDVRLRALMTLLLKLIGRLFRRIFQAAQAANVVTDGWFFGALVRRSTVDWTLRLDRPVGHENVPRARDASRPRHNAVPCTGILRGIALGRSTIQAEKAAVRLGVCYSYVWKAYEPEFERTSSERWTLCPRGGGRSHVPWSHSVDAQW